MKKGAKWLPFFMARDVSFTGLVGPCHPTQALLLALEALLNLRGSVLHHLVHIIANLLLNLSGLVRRVNILS